MSEKLFSGTGVALVTPFNPDGSIDFTSLEKLIHHVTENGVNYLVALGTTAETPTLSTEEKISVLAFIKKVNAGRLPLICGIGGNHTADVIHQIQSFPLNGIDGILCVTPYYNKPTQAGLIAHFTAISKICPKPIILYNVPGRTGVNMLPVTTITLAKQCENIVAIKEAAGSMPQTMELVKLSKQLNKSFTLLSGDDDLAMSQIAAGFDGVISVAANNFTKDFCNMIQLSRQHSFTAAQEIHYKLLDGINLLFADGNPAGVKYFLSKMGICQNIFRLPVVPVSEATANKIDVFLQS